MTRDEADVALVHLCEREYGAAVNKFLGRKNVPQNVFDGMVSVCYNLGARCLQWKWAAACKAGNYAAGAALLRSTGTTAQGVRLAGLVRRRAEEATLIEKGIYTLAHQTARAHQADAMADRVLRRGERGPAVAELIRDLSVLGYYNGRIDDVFGPGTESAVLAFQREHGLKDDGFAGPKTLRAIQEQMPKPAAKPAESRSAPPAPTTRGKAGIAAGGAIAAAGAVIAAKWSGFTGWICQFLWFCV